MPSAMLMIGTINVPPPMPRSPDAIPPKNPSPTPRAIVFPEWMISASVIIAACLFWFLFLYTLMIVRVATSMRKTPKTKPSKRSSMMVASHAPMYAPGAVVITRISPVL